MSLTQKDLDQMRCTHPDHEPGACEGGPLHFHHIEHLSAPLQVSYHEGTLTITCAECGKFVANVAVKEDDSGDIPFT